MLAVTIVSVILVFVASVTGWFFTYRLTVKSQNRLLWNQILNDVRMSINKSLVDYEKWLSDIVRSLRALEADSTAERVWEHLKSAFPELLEHENRNAIAFAGFQCNELLPDLGDKIAAFLSEEDPLLDALEIFQGHLASWSWGEARVNQSEIQTLLKAIIEEADKLLVAMFDIQKFAHVLCLGNILGTLDKA